jgi:hypothetical protein
MLCRLHKAKLAVCTTTERVARALISTVRYNTVILAYLKLYLCLWHHASCSGLKAIVKYELQFELYKNGTLITTNQSGAGIFAHSIFVLHASAIGAKF